MSELMLEKNTKIPSGWLHVEFSNVVNFKKGKKPKTSYSFQKSGFLPYILIDEMEGKPIRNFTNDFDCPLVNKEDILIVWDGSVGKTTSGIHGIIGSTIAALSPILINTKYVEYFLKFKKPFIESTSKGITLQHINPDVFWKMSFPLCSIYEQKRIVDRVEELFLNIEMIEQNLNKILKMLDVYVDSLLLWTFDPTFNSDITSNSWGELTLHKIIPKNGIFDGPFGSNLKTSDYVHSGIRVIRLENIKKLKFDESKSSFINNEKYEKLKKHTVKTGDIIVASFVDRELKCCVIPKLTEICINKADCFCIRPNPDIIPEFLMMQLSSPFVYSQLSSKIHGVTRKRINTKQLRSVSLHICDPKKQNHIVDFLNTNFSLIYYLKKELSSYIHSLELLKITVLKKSFEGKLVPQDPNDESAEILLEKIKQEKQKIISQTKRGKKNDK